MNTEELKAKIKAVLDSFFDFPEDEDTGDPTDKLEDALDALRKINDIIKEK